MNNANYIRLMKKERERREARIKAEAEALKQAEAEALKQAEELQEVDQDVITDRENGDNEQDTES